MGFALVAAACCLSGLRWSLTQILLGSDHGGDPMTVLYHISPASALCCIPVFLLVELRPLMASHLLDVRGCLGAAAGAAKATRTAAVVAS